jgi:predicted HicB family RNase H-like nuclease
VKRLRIDGTPKKLTVKLPVSEHRAAKIAAAEDDATLEFWLLEQIRKSLEQRRARAGARA